MIRPLHTAIAAAALLAVNVAIAVPATATTIAPRGTLTSTEYTQLTMEQVAFKKLDKQKNLTWNDFYAACHKVGQSTTLLASIRTNCETGIGIDQSLTGFYSDLERCAALSSTTTTSTTTTTTSTGTTTTGTGTTTTGTTTATTTTGTGTTTTGAGTLTPAQLKLYACLQPEYAVISRAAESVYQAQAALRRQVLTRQFVGRCLVTLAPSTAQLRALTRFAATAKQLAKDVGLLTKVANGQAPASAINGPQIQRDADAFDAAGKAFAAIHRPQKLSVCPHQ